MFSDDAYIMYQHVRLSHSPFLCLFKSSLTNNTNLSILERWASPHLSLRDAIYSSAPTNNKESQHENQSNGVPTSGVPKQEGCKNQVQSKKASGYPEVLSMVEDLGVRF